MFDLITFLDDFEQDSHRQAAKLETLDISLYGLVNGVLVNDKIFEALYMVLGLSKRTVVDLRLSISADCISPDLAPKTCCEMHKPCRRPSDPMLDQNIGIIFPNVQRVELGIDGVFQYPERWLGVDFSKVKDLKIRYIDGDQYFDLKVGFRRSIRYGHSFKARNTHNWFTNRETLKSTAFALSTQEASRYFIKQKQIRLLQRSHFL
ncbi:hypothetical protein ABW21_db0202837 [Orbilia brochopaga]|nr:hypothetical protein ABW21_db0202837 [Drechslerella brochopaga]